MKLLKDSIKLIKKQPKLIVFDLDHTLWNLGIDDFYFKPPYKRDTRSKNINDEYKVLDCQNKEMEPYPEVNSLLKFLDQEIKIPLALASRTTYPDGAFSLLTLYDWIKYFKYMEIYPGKKFAHFKQFNSKTKINYKEMLFFDDEDRNIRDLNTVGVTCIKIDPSIGMNFEYLSEGFEKHSKKDFD